MPRESDEHGTLFYVVWVPSLSFALFFVLVFPLAYAFPPRTAELTLRDEFPGARKVVWPIVILACAAVAWLVISTAK
jgi:peptidoglycan/LPS O-acetylase OafA/YrhL